MRLRRQAGNARLRHQGACSIRVPALVVVDQSHSYSIDTPITRPNPALQLTRDNDLRRPTSISFPAPARPNMTSSIPNTPTPPGPSRPSTPPVSLPPLTRIKSRQSWTGILKDLPLPIPKSWSRAPTPTASSGGTPTGELDGWLSEKDEKERMRVREKEERALEKEKERAKRKEKRRRRKKAEIFVRTLRLRSFAMLISVARCASSRSRSHATSRRSFSAKSSFASSRGP